MLHIVRIGVANEKKNISFPRARSTTYRNGYGLFAAVLRIVEIFLKWQEKRAGADIIKICAEQENLLNQTRYTQVAMLATELCILEDCQKRIWVKSLHIGRVKSWRISSSGGLFRNDHKRRWLEIG